MGHRFALTMLVAALFVTQFGCAKKEPAKTAPSPAPPQAAQAYVIDAATGMAPVTWGMSVDQVQAALGPAEKTVQQGQGKILVLYYLSKGFTLTLYKDKGLTGITCLSWQIALAFSSKAANFPGKTAEGICIGSTEEAIFAAYGLPQERTVRGNMVDLTYGRHLEKIFYLQNKRLVQFSINAPREEPRRLERVPGPSSDSK